MPEVWEVQIHRKVNDVVYTLPPSLVTALRQVIWNLQIDPYPLGSRRVGSSYDLFELFVRLYRIVYQVNEEQNLVRVVRIHTGNETK